jgi:ribonucleotide reductase beta subunit family protein with ferritin-like domain
MPPPPEFVVFTKPGCAWCTRAKGLLDAAGRRYAERVLASVGELQRALTDAGHPGDLVATFPQVLHGAAFVGTYEQLRDYLDEPLLAPDAGTRRFTPFPVKYHALWDMYLKAVASFWTADEVSLVGDVADWRDRLNDDERHFIKHVLAFFAGADGIVMENLQLNFGVEVKAPEARQFYAYQAFNEAEHSRQYALLIDALIADAAERERLFGAIETLPAVRKKAEWAMKWLSPTRRFAERLVAWVCVEGILFSGSFCSIFWLKQRGLMPGLGLSNQFISRDEGLHQQFGVLLYHHLRHALDADTVRAIVTEAVDNEKEFITEAIPCRLVGMNAELMGQYIEFVADRVLASLGVPPAYGAANPFPWMELISLSGKDNFFERFSSEYQRAGVMAAPQDQQFSVDEAF